MSENLLLVRAGARTCALPMAHVVEVMRPLPIEKLPEAPEHVPGVATIRGLITPIVSLRVLLGEGQSETAKRLITVRQQGDQVAGILVDEVLGVNMCIEVDDLPSLFDAFRKEWMEGLGLNDGKFLLILKTASLVPDDVLAVLTTEGVGS